MRLWWVAATLAAVSSVALAAFTDATSSRGQVELVDVSRKTVVLITHLYDYKSAPAISRLRYSVRPTDGSAQRTTVVQIGNYTRWTFDGTYSDSCNVVNAPSSGTDLVQLTGALASSGYFTEGYPTGGAVDSMTRNLPTKRYVVDIKNKIIGATNCTLAGVWEADRNAAMRFTLAGACGNTSSEKVDIVGNVMWYVPITQFENNLFNALGKCNASNPVMATSAPSSTTVAPAALLFPLPTLPSQFSALIQTTLLERNVSFNIYESFSYGAKAARSTLMTATKSATVVVSGDVGLAFVQESNQGLNSVLDEPVTADGRFTTRRLGFGACEKHVFNLQLVGNVQDLLLRSRAGSGPRYMGRITVRDIPTVYWRSTAKDYTITWFFQDPNPPAAQTFAPPTAAPPTTAPPSTAAPPPNVTSATTAAPTPGTTTVAAAATTTAAAAATTTAAPNSRAFHAEQSSATRLLRVNVVGRGLSPFFTLHPFYQRGMPPPAKSEEACRAVLGDVAADECTDSGKYFHHQYDFVSFVPRVDDAEIAVPDSCIQDGASSVHAQVASVECEVPTSDAMIAFAVIFTAIFAALFGAFGMFYWNRRKQMEKAKRDAQLNEEED
jgi:hypothetical protein